MLESTKQGIPPFFFFGSRESLSQLQTDRKTERRVRGHSGSAYLGPSPAAGFRCLVHIRSGGGDAKFPGRHGEAIETALGSSRSEQHRDGVGHPLLRWHAVTAGWLVADDRYNERFGAATPPGHRRAHARLPRPIDTRGAAEEPLARNFLGRKRRGAGCWTGTDWHRKQPGTNRCGSHRARGPENLGPTRRHRRWAEADYSFEWPAHGGYGTSRRGSWVD